MSAHVSSRLATSRTQLVAPRRFKPFVNVRSSGRACSPLQASNATRDAWALRSLWPVVGSQRAQWRTSASAERSDDSLSSYDEPLPQQHAADPNDKLITQEILSICLPVLATLAADPIAGLVGTAFIGRLGSLELAACGVALSIFTATTRLLNVPLLSVTTSAVASAAGSKDPEASVASSTAAAIVLALVAGLLQAGVLMFWGPAAASLWGAPAGSAMHSQALDFLAVRALGAPATILMLVLQGVFRGIQDTRTPFYATLVANAVNLLAAPLLIFHLGWGAPGAAWATVGGEAVAAGLLLFELAKRVRIRPADAATLKEVVELFVPTGFLMARTVAIQGTFAVATSMAARAGPTAAATHQVCLQVWLASSLLADSLAVASQSLLARSLAIGQPTYGRKVVDRSTVLAILLGLALSGTLALGHSAIPKLFTSDPALLASIATLMPFIILTQPLNALAFAWDGALFGAGGFKYASLATAVSAAPAVALMAAGGAAGGTAGLQWVWSGLAVLMGMRAASIWLPYQLRTGPFARLFEGKADGGR